LIDLRQTNDPPRCSATGVGSTGYACPRLLEETFGFKFRVISGYPGEPSRILAMERNEVQCRAITIDGFFGREPFHTWMKKGFVRVVLQTEKKTSRQVADVPTIFELMEQYKISDTKRRLIIPIWASGALARGRSVSTPNVPPERLKILRDAFMRMFKDPRCSTK
jgi:hypothetical protein